MRLSRNILFCIVLALPSLTLAQTIFDVSGTILQGPNVLAAANWSGTLTVTQAPSGELTVSNWSISVPSIQLTNGSLSGSVFNPIDSTVTVLTQVNETSFFTSFNFLDTQTGESFHIVVNPYPWNNYPVLGSSEYVFYENGILYTADGTTALSPVPEPSSCILLATSLAGLAAFRRKLLTRLPTFHS